MIWARLKTFFVVLLLTTFIWVLAERQGTRSAEVNLTVTLPVLQGDYLVQCLDENRNPLGTLSRTVKLNVEGPGSRLQQLGQEDFTVELPPLAEPPAEGVKDYTVDVVKEILEGQLVSQVGVLNVISAEPAYIDVRLTRLTRRTLPVKVRDAQGDHELTVESVKPAELNTLVMGTVPSEATVRLNAKQQRLAQQEPIRVAAEVKIGNRVIDEQMVEVKLAAAGNTLPIAEIAKPRLGIVLPPSMQCRYRVVIDPGSEPALEPIRFRGSTTAISDYRDARYHLVLEVEEKDLRDDTTTILRPLQYLLPEAYRQEITILNPEQRVVRFHVEPCDQPTETK